MAAPIGPGDLVRCVDASPRRHDVTGEIGFVCLVQGAIYTVDRVFDVNGEACVALVESPTVGSNFWADGYCVERFRPIYRRDEGLINRLLQPIDERVSA